MNVEYFNWQIGKLPAGWHRDMEVKIINASFAGGPMAAMYACDTRLEFDSDEMPVVVRFHERDAVRVQRWIMWLQGN
jgi:hypothetical protein